MKNFHPGHSVNQGYYRAFVPSVVNRRWEVTDDRLIQLLSQADQMIGRLDMFSKYVDIEHYISMHVAKEATQSSRIEGTRTEIQEVFLPVEDIENPRRADWEEVKNYIEAMQYAMATMKKLPFSSRLFREIHAILMRGVRGQSKQPGAYRQSQNWIGGATIQEATHVPPPHGEIGRLMSDLEKFANDPYNPLPDLLKVGIIHYQFETIHPFLDGNGRVGRLMITLYLVDRGVLARPILYLSDFFERNRRLYYDHLSGGREKGGLLRWLKFFLSGIIETAESGIQTFERVLNLQRSLPDRLVHLGNRSSDALVLLESMFENPVVSPVRASEIIGKSVSTANRLLADLANANLLEEVTGGERNRLFSFREYLALFER